MRLSERAIFTIFLTFVVMVTFVYYGPFLHNFFTFDDFALIEHAVQGPKATLLGYNCTLRFVNNIVWIPLNIFFGFDPFGYNFFSLLLWLLNALLVYRFLRRLLDDALPAALVGFIFAATAIGADAVFWLAASGTLINVSFYLLTLHAYTVFRQTGETRQWRISLIFFILAIFSKEEAASLPLVVLLLEWLYFNGRSDARGVIRRFLTYSAIVVATVVMNYIVIFQIMHAQSELLHISKFRPLHTLFSSWTVFFLTPDGRLVMGDLRIYITVALISTSFFVVKDRRLLFLGFGWIFLTFLPQSLSNISQFEPSYLFSSLSRHLYLPSIGAAMIYVAIIVGLRDRFSKNVAVMTSLLFILVYLPYNYRLVSSRGVEWRSEGEPSKYLLHAIQQTFPDFPPNTYIYVNGAPRAYILQALRGLYKNFSMNWIVDPRNFKPKPGETAIIIDCNWQPDGDVRLQLYNLEQVQ